MNRVILVGRLGREPELRYTSSGSAVANFSLATSDRYTNKKGEKEERTEWHQIVVWTRMAEACAEYLDKGSLVCVEGELRTEEWEDKDGAKRKTTKVHALRVEFLVTGRREKKQRTEDEQAKADGYEEDIPF